MLLQMLYASPNHGPRLFQNILDWTQGDNESIIDYITSMLTMFKRYVTEGIKEYIIVRNLSPFYSTVGFS